MLLTSCLFNRHLNRGCLVYMFSLRFSGSKFLINLWQQFRVRKFFRERKIFPTQVLAGFAVFSFCISFVRNLSLLINRLLTSAFLSRIAFNRSNGLIIKCLIACLMN